METSEQARRHHFRGGRGPMTEAVITPGAVGPETRRRGRRWRQIAIGAFGLVLLAFAASFPFRSFERRRWKEFCEAQRVLSARLAAEPVNRVRVLDVSEEGDGWESYRAAAMRIGIATHEERSDILGRWPNRPNARRDDPDPAATARILEKFARALGDVRSGTRRESKAVPGRPAAFPNPWTADFANNLLMASVRGREASGDPAGALDDLAAALQLELDFAVGNRFTEKLEWLLRLLARADLPVESLPRVEEIAARIEANEIPVVRSLEVNRARLARFVGEGSALNLPEGFVIANVETWRYGFSARLAICEADRLWEQTIRMAQGIERMGARQAEQLCWPLFHKYFANPVTRPGSLDSGWDPGRLEIASRTRRAQIRLVRAAAMTRRGLGPDSPGWPLDPWDFAPLRRRATAQEWVLWCIGLNGDDGGENGGFTGAADRDHCDMLVRIPK